MNLSNEKILHHYLDGDTVTVEAFLDNNGWVTPDGSDIFIEGAIRKTKIDAGRRYNGDQKKSISRFIIHPKLNKFTP